ncbi:MAG: serine/threonine-protein kinase, partial [Eggerthellaceae bacterium]|nr:serine/threonine-protein kinase [Eggerthellaceae bacterium]
GAREDASDFGQNASFSFEHSLVNIPGLDEARTAAMLSDANIVTVYDFQIQGTTAYLIMEYVEGITLTQLLRQVGDNLSLNVVTAVFASVAHALETAHRNQVLHLDIKPDNVLINRQGQVKVTDFGLATLADAGGYGMAGGGTIGYMPLEQMRQEHLDARCDEWALASLTYEMLTGDNPFLARTLEQAEEAIEEAELVLPSLCWEDVDPRVDDVVFTALDPEANERFATVVDFAEELEPLLGDAKAGHRELAAIMSGMGQELSAEPSCATVEPRAKKQHVPLVDRLSPRVVLVLSRVVAVLAASLIAAVAMANVVSLIGDMGPLEFGPTPTDAQDAQDAGAAAADIDATATDAAGEEAPAAAGSEPGSALLDSPWGNPVLWGVVLLVALGAAVRPHIGALLSIMLLAVAMLFGGSPVAAALLVLATGAWWWFSGRRGAAEADVVLMLPLFGAFGCAPVVPMAAGCLLPLTRTAVAVGYASFLAVVLGSFGSGSMAGWQVWAYWDVTQVDVQANMLALLLQPSTWIIVASWMAAALAFSAFCYRGTRAFDVAGAVVAAVVLVAGACIAGGLSADVALSSPLWVQSFKYVFPASLAAVLGIAAAASGIPDRARWE